MGIITSKYDGHRPNLQDPAPFFNARPVCGRFVILRQVAGINDPSAWRQQLFPKVKVVMMESAPAY
jgi:hypothetical protein